ncbi:MAG TPA: hypothetical protein VI248_00620 [Kineosporiaceae bacterium]
MSPRHSPGPGQPPAADAETGLLLGEAVRRGAGSPVDADALVGAARARAARIRRHRRATVTAAAGVLAAVPLGVLGIRFSVEHTSPSVASGISASPRGDLSSAGPVVAPAPTDSGPHVITFANGGGRTTQLTFGTRTRTIAGTTAQTTYPVVTATGGSPDLQGMVQQTLTRRVDALVDAYRQRVVALRAGDAPSAQTIDVSGEAHWRNTVSILIRDTQDIPGSVPTETAAAIVLDTGTGEPVPADSLFTDVPAADAIARHAIAATIPQGTITPSRLATLTMRTRTPTGASTSLAWYPGQNGLTWIINPDSSSPDATTLSVTTPWASLAPVLRP